MNVELDIIEDEEGRISFVTNTDGKDIIHTPILNKGSGFTKEEREIFHLDGLLPPRCLTTEQQLEKIKHRYDDLGKTLAVCGEHEDFDPMYLAEMKIDNNITRYNFLRDLQDRNELLFYMFAYRYMEEITPIIYTPTVGEAVMRFSHDAARFRGIFLSPNNINTVESVFEHVRFKKPTIAVVTDNQGILGLGDQGVGGIDIPIGKLALYVLGAGIRPWETLPVTLDVGTDNPKDLEDDYYMGYKAGRLQDKEYDSFMDRFIEGITTKFPEIAFTILDRYRSKVMSFNDDIQGTGAVALGGIISALKITGESLSDQRFVIYGAGAGGIGIARQISAALQLKHNLTGDQADSLILALDSKGMLTTEREIDEYKKQFAKAPEFYSSWELEDSSKITLFDTVKNFQPTVLIGTSGMAGHFTKEIILAMTDNTERPLIFPLSNPTSKAEALPEEIYKLTSGRAVVATGSPFERFSFEGKVVIIGQGNNMFIFPGVGLGAIMSPETYIGDEVFTEAAYTLASETPDELIQRGTVYPAIKEIRRISSAIALSTVKAMSKDDESELSSEDVETRMWVPQYHSMIRTKK
jgi:malate dehydrogenase (oxaloacetate-decarboxylating)